MARVMVSGPFSVLLSRSDEGPNIFAPAFRLRLTDVIELLKGAGHEVFSAHIAEAYGETPWEDNFVRRDLRWSAECDVQLVLLPTSELGDVVRSDGTMIELGFAFAKGKPIILLADDLQHDANSYFLRSFPELEHVDWLPWTEGYDERLLETINSVLEGADSSSHGRKQTTDVDAVLAELKASPVPHTVEVAGFRLTVPPGVFSPRLSHSPDALFAVWDIPPGSAVLDLGCGCGVLGLAALKAGAARLVALDVNPDAVEATKSNLAALNFKSIGEARLSDAYSALLEREKFDIIILAAPYWDRPASDYLERSCFDEGHEFFQRAVKEGHKWLADNGRMYVLFSDQGGLSLAIRTIEDSGLRFEEMHLQRPTQPGGHIRIVWALGRR